MKTGDTLTLSDIQQRHGTTTGTRVLSLRDIQQRTSAAEQEVSPQEPVKESPDRLQQTGDVLNAIFGGKQIGEAIGTQIAKFRATPEEREFIEDGPSFKQVAGDTARVASNFIPVTRAGNLFTKGLVAAGATKGVQTAGNIAAGALTGAAIDVTEDVANDREVGLGAATVIGAGIPAASPLIGALARATAKGAGRVSTEITGALTGTSQETVEQAFLAARAGGNDAAKFTEALRGKITPEALVGNLDNSIGMINTSRQNLFRSTLSELSEEVVETQFAKNDLTNALKNARIGVKDTGVLDFSGSTLKLVPQAQSKINAAFKEVMDLPANASLLEVDTARQAVKALKLTGDDASANLGNKLIDDAVRSIRSVGEDVPGYGQMLDEFTETSEFLTDLQKGLSSGDRTTVDQTYRRMATALKTNNEQRMALVRELDNATDGAILSSISGQQLSEMMPRGIFRQISAGIAGGAVLSGGVSSSMLPALVLASPRAVGEFARSLGIGARKTEVFIQSILQAKNLLIKAGAITGAAVDDNK